MPHPCCQSLQAYLDGDLSEQEWSQILCDRIACPDCSEAIRFEREWESRFRRAWDEILDHRSNVCLDPPPLQPKSSQLKSNPQRSRVWLWPIGLAASLLLAWFGYQALHSSSESARHDPGRGSPFTDGSHKQRNDRKDTEFPFVTSQSFQPSESSGVRMSNRFIGIAEEDSDDFLLVSVYPVQ